MDQPLTGPVLFRTERLTVRRLAAGDVEDLLAVYGDREVVRWVDDGEPLTRADAERWVEVTDRNFARRGRGMAALVLTATGEVVGFCGIVRPGDQEEDEVKYALRRDRWGQGLATEVVEAMLGPTGNLRAPTLRKGKTVLVGFNEEVFERVLG